MSKTAFLFGAIMLLVLAPAFTMQIVDPAPGVTWCRGDRVEINWNFFVTPQGPCTVSLLQGKTVVAVIVRDLAVPQSHVSWTVPRKIAEGWYQVRVTMANCDRSATSSKFRIRDCSRLATRTPEGPDSITTPDPRNDVAVDDLYLAKNGKLWIKYKNLGNTAINVTVWEEVWVGDHKIYEGRILLNMSIGGIRAHEVDFSCFSRPPLKKSLRVKGIIDARGEFREVNEANNTLVKVLTCPQGIGK